MNMWSLWENIKSKRNWESWNWVGYCSYSWSHSQMLWLLSVSSLTPPLSECFNNFRNIRMQSESLQKDHAFAMCCPSDAIFSGPFLEYSGYQESYCLIQIFILSCSFSWFSCVICYIVSMEPTHFVNKHILWRHLNELWTSWTTAVTSERSSSTNLYHRDHLLSRALRAYDSVFMIHD